VPGLRVLAVDDEELALNDLTWLLDQSDTIDEVVTARSGNEALRVLNDRSDIDAVFLDVHMPGLSGVDLVGVLNNFKSPPAVAFVTAFDKYAVDAFDLNVCDYLMKPVAQNRLDETIRRIHAQRHENPTATDDAALAQLTARNGNTTHRIDRSAVSVVEASGDYVRVFTASDSHLVRESISSLTSAWSAAGFVRIHRSYLVRSSAITEVRNSDGRRTVVVGDRELPVSRRYSRLLQDRLGGLQ
jgi:DNA-binding LytR/AlgR family response regulator